MEAKKRLLIGLVIGAGLLIIYGPAFLRWTELKARQEQLEAEVTALRKENRQLVEEARRLREDPAYAEAEARRQFGFVRPGETVVKFRDQKTKNSPP